MTTYDIGDEVRLSVAFTDAAGAAADPTTVTCTVRKPDGSTLTPTATSTGSTGAYRADIQPDQTGNWYYRFAGTGALVAAEEGQFYVRTRRA